MNKNYRLSLIMNIIIAVFTLIGTIVMFTGFNFMGESLLSATKVNMFQFFTVDSNILMGIASIVFIIFEIKLLGGSIKEIPKNVYLLKLMATSAVSLTFIVVFLYLGPAKYGIWPMIQNANLFFHLLTPVLSIITFVLFEKTDKLKYSLTFCGIIPTIVYGIFYITNILVHMENGVVSTQYDFYWFVQNGVWTSVIVIPFILFVSYLISFGLWKFNKRG